MLALLLGLIAQADAAPSTTARTPARATRNMVFTPAKSAPGPRLDMQRPDHATYRAHTELAVPHDRLAAHEHVPARETEFHTFERSVTLAGTHQRRAHPRRGLRIDDHEVGVEAGRDRT